MKRWMLAGCVVFVAVMMIETVRVDSVGTVSGRTQSKLLGTSGFGGWWEDPEIKRDLNLTEDQVSRIRHFVRSKRGELIDLKSTTEKKLLILADEVERLDFDLGKAITAAEEYQRARYELQRARLKHLMELRSVLNQEQYFKLKAMWQQRKIRFWKERPGVKGKP